MKLPNPRQMTPRDLQFGATIAKKKLQPNSNSATAARELSGKFVAKTAAGPGNIFRESTRQYRFEPCFLMNEWVLITGASSGIGLELAKLFAADRFNLVLIARNEAKLNELAAELRGKHEIETRVLAKDLVQPNAAQEIFDALRDTPISILVNNAGIGWHGAFAETELQRSLEVMNLNMNSLVQLTHLFVQPMLQRRAGKILNVASTAAFQPGPMVAIYYASKAFVHSFSYALAEELEESGIEVTTLCPGTTHTNFFERGNFGPLRAPFTMSAKDVAIAGYRGLMRGKRVVIPGLTNKVASFLAKRVPLPLTTAVVRRLHRKRSR